jgi:hypothetical protein
MEVVSIHPLKPNKKPKNNDLHEKNHAYQWRRCLAFGSPKPSLAPPLLLLSECCFDSVFELCRNNEEESSIYSKILLKGYAPSCHDEAHRGTMAKAARVSVQKLIVPRYNPS